MPEKTTNSPTEMRPAVSAGASYDPGLTQQYAGKLTRIVTRDGRFNIRRAGSNWHDWSPYTYLISISWTKFSVFVFIAYVVVNFLFAWAYYLLGPGEVKIPGSTSPLVRFSNLFFFSAHTLTTVGYGNMYPEGLLGNLIASIEGLLGLMAFAIATGLLFGRFSRPSARFGFSQHIVIAPYLDGTSLQLRVVNRRSHNLIEIEAQVILMTVEVVNGQLQRKFTILELERKQVAFLTLTWTIVHPINDQSPLFGKTASDLEALQAEVIVTMKGFDETFGQLVYGRYSYRYDEIVWGGEIQGRFRDRCPRGTDSLCR